MNHGDPRDEPTVRHPLHPSFRLPATFTALVGFVMDGLDLDDPDTWEYAAWTDNDIFCGDLDHHLLGAPVPDDRTALYGELSYGYQPFEILPFCFNGGDALHYGWAVLAPELDADDHPCVSFAPVDDHAVWLGDNTRQALENLLAGSLANWTDHGREQGLKSPAGDERWAAACRALDLHPERGSGLVGPGARSNRALSPQVPDGWRYQPTGDGIGVLAPEPAFAPEGGPVAQPWDSERRLAAARGFLYDGYPASALAVLKTSGYDRPMVELMRDAYRRLGRDLHADRVELWLGLHRD